MANHGIARSEIDRKLTNFLFDLNKQKSLGQRNKILIQIIKTESHGPSIDHRLEPVYRPRTPYYPKFTVLIILLAFPKETYNLLPGYFGKVKIIRPLLDY